jgi:hypothetical protein
LRSAHSARVPQNLRLASLLPVTTIFSQIFWFGSSEAVVAFF